MDPHYKRILKLIFCRYCADAVKAIKSNAKCLTVTRKMNLDPLLLKELDMYQELLGKISSRNRFWMYRSNMLTRDPRATRSRKQSVRMGPRYHFSDRDRPDLVRESLIMTVNGWKWLNWESQYEEHFGRTSIIGAKTWRDFSVAQSTTSINWDYHCQCF